MTLSVSPVSPAEHTLIRHLYPLYLHDLSEFGDGYSLDAEGLWQPDYLPYWLSGKEGFSSTHRTRCGKDNVH